MCKKLLIGIIAGALALTTTMAFGFSTTVTTREFIGFGSPSGSLDASGLGSQSKTYSAGSYSVRAFLDYEIELADTGFWPESGYKTGSADSRLSWEINVPHYNSVTGDIYDNFKNNSLDMSKNVLGDDVAVALAWNFTVDTGYTANISFFVTDALDQTNLPSFYITQTDDYSGNSIYFYSTLVTSPGNGTTPVPEPSTIVFLGTALAGLGLYARKRKNV